MEMIKTVDLHKSFGDLKVLTGVNQTIEKGEVVSIIGPSGGGKSTFLRCLNLLETPTSGKIIFDGADICDKGTDINKHRQKMGMVFQQFNLFNNMNVMRCSFSAQCFTQFFAQIRIPSVGHSCRGGEASGGNGGIQTQMVACAFLLTKAVRAVGQEHSRNTLLRKRKSFPGRFALQQGCLLFKRQLGDGFLNHWTTLSFLQKK